MISRIWHGWTTPANADKYEAMLKEEIFINILCEEIWKCCDYYLKARTKSVLERVSIKTSYIASEFK